MANLRVGLVQPQGHCEARKGSIIEAAIAISARDVEEGIAKIDYDQNYLQLADSTKEVKLNIRTYNRTVTWYLVALRQADKTHVTIIVSARLAQAVTFSVTIT